jgi:hypothetical protein
MNKPLLYLVGVLVLLLIVMWTWKSIAVGNAERRFEEERSGFAEQQSALEERLRAEGTRRVEDVLRLMGVPLGWAIRAEAIRDGEDRIEEYATSLIKQPRIKQFAFVDASGVVKVSTDRKLDGVTAESVFGPLTRHNEITLRETEAGDHELMVPILGYDSRLGSVVVTVDGS